MADTDWGIVVGVQRYPDLDPLNGCDNDARDFHAWLLAPTGGNITKPEQVFLITTSMYPPFSNAEEAMPTERQVRLAAQRIQRVAHENFLNTGTKKYVGRRLYLYLAGHGFAPTREQTALLMADASKRNVGPPYHWLGEWTAEWFYRAGYFDEIVLIMDCCREIYPVEGLNMPWTADTASDFTERVKRFYAYATRWSLLTREQMDGARSRGVFTRALLDGLQGAAHVPGSRQITTASLKKYLLDSIGTPNLMPSDFVADDFVICEAQTATQYPVRITLPFSAAGKKVQILDSTFNTVQETIGAPPEWNLWLDKGSYLVMVVGTEQRMPFPVDGTGEAHADLR